MSDAPWLSRPDTPKSSRGSLRKPRLADPIPDSVKQLVRTRSGHLCELCGVAPGQHFHHRKLRRCGDHTARNVVHLCNTCHTRCHGHVRWALDTGWIVSQYDDPAMREVLWRGRDWAWLADDGRLLHVPPVKGSA